MVRWAILLSLVLLTAACAVEGPHRRRRHRRHRHRRPRPVLVVEEPPARRGIRRRVCAPVGSCGRFVGCAFAEEEPDPEMPGQVRYVVRRFDAEPSRVNTALEWGRLCWTEPGGRSCADAFDLGTRCPEAGPDAPQGEAPPRCEVRGEVCGTFADGPEPAGPPQ